MKFTKTGKRMNRYFFNYVENFGQIKSRLRKEIDLIPMMNKYCQLLLKIYMHRETGKVLSNDIHKHHAPHLNQAFFGRFLISQEEEDSLLDGLRTPLNREDQGIDISTVGVGSAIWHPGRLVDCIDKIVIRDKRWQFDESNHYAIYLLPFSILWFANGNHSSCIGFLFGVPGLVYPEEIMDFSPLLPKWDTDGNYFWDENRVISENPQPELAAIWKIYRNHLACNDIPFPGKPHNSFHERIIRTLSRMTGQR